MNKLSPPEAFAGYEFSKFGLFHKVCRMCPDRIQAIREARAVSATVKWTLCSKHLYETTNARTGDRRDE